MKTIEITDNEGVFIGNDHSENEKINYVFLDKVYLKLKLIQISGVKDFSLSFEGTRLNAPNLKYFVFDGECAFNILKSMKEDFLHAPALEGMAFHDIKLDQMPQFLKRIMTLKELSFRNGNLTEIPSEIFEMKNLRTLRFEYFNKIKIIPDDIKRLKNLESFTLWQAPIEYLSPELFLLPKISNINFVYCNYNPTKDVIDVLKKYKSTGKTFSGWEGYVE